MIFFVMIKTKFYGIIPIKLENSMIFIWICFPRKWNILQKICSFEFFRISDLADSVRYRDMSNNSDFVYSWYLLRKIYSSKSQSSY